MLAEFRPQLEEGNLEIVVYPDRMTLALAQDVTFASGSAKLTPAGDGTLDALADLLTRYPDRRFDVEGHTDDVPVNGGSNWELGAARAVAVVESLVADGVPPQLLSATTYGETQPLVANDDPQGREVNRRVESRSSPRWRSCRATGPWSTPRSG